MYKFLKLYERPDHFMDSAQFDRREYYVAAGQHRDSNLLERHNFEEFVEAMKEHQQEESEAGWMIIRDRHWAVGWVEGLYIHKNAIVLCDVAEELLHDLSQYPILNDSMYSYKVHDEMYQQWSMMPYRERMALLKENGEFEDGMDLEGIPEDAYRTEEYIREMAER